MSSPRAEMVTSIQQKPAETTAHRIGTQSYHGSSGNGPCEKLGGGGGGAARVAAGGGSTSSTGSNRRHVQGLSYGPFEIVYLCATEARHSVST